MCCTQLAENTGRKKFTIYALSHNFIGLSLQLRHLSAIGKKLVKQQCLPRCPWNLSNFGPLTAEIGSRVWGTPAHFNGFRVLAALLHDTPVKGFSQNLWRGTEGATYIRQGGHHVGHWPTFLVLLKELDCP